MKNLRKNIFSYFLVLFGLGFMIYSNWQFCVGIVLMICGGYMWQLQNETKRGTPQIHRMKQPPKKEVDRKEANASNLKVE